eukprot:CAMPEP_0184649476 /NCGR_PEP_ID=MMETSP0308-20130426/6860_1 /TAXON_ID=38269 /ORGANISM="Gloeochaete witrockiana, Strain SAG 46.84" /LENGTH=117 /DNA_ID=CAMNT_0027082239 /DNA_START=256 /DNA_END=609 /DNA_ORIENTATION=-
MRKMESSTYSASVKRVETKSSMASRSIYRTKYPQVCKWNTLKNVGTFQDSNVLYKPVFNNNVMDIQIKRMPSSVLEPLQSIWSVSNTGPWNAVFAMVEGPTNFETIPKALKTSSNSH